MSGGLASLQWILWSGLLLSVWYVGQVKVWVVAKCVVLVQVKEWAVAKCVVLGQVKEWAIVSVWYWCR